MDTGSYFTTDSREERDSRERYLIVQSIQLCASAKNALRDEGVASRAIIVAATSSTKLHIGSNVFKRVTVHSRLLERV